MSPALKVLGWYLIPFGGGIPAGTIAARDSGVPIWEMVSLYIVSDMILACIFEPCMLFVIARVQDNPKLAEFFTRYKQSLEQLTGKWGVKPSPLSLVLMSFLIDPMTGRVLARGAGHGFLAGWAIAITGDMFSYSLVAASTLGVAKVTGDGTSAAVIVMIGMVVVPRLLKRAKAALFGSKQSP